MSKYTIYQHNRWVEEVKNIYATIKKDETPYYIDFLGYTLEVCENVFSPKYFNNTSWYARALQKIVGKGHLLEVGTGIGAIAIYCAKKGIKVTATDISGDAFRCARNNIKRQKCNIDIYLGDVFNPLPEDIKYDYIFWNHPYNNSEVKYSDPLIVAGFDYKYKSLNKYISEARQYLTVPEKGLLLGTGGHADINEIKKISKKNEYRMVLLDLVKMPLGYNTKEDNDFRIYHLIK